MYLMIENDGVAHVNAFTVLGVSSARGKDDKIGQFGSGGKHATTLLLRQGINPIIFLGGNELKFFSKPENFENQSFQRLCYAFNDVITESNISLDFGVIDWTSTDMALREYVSNAIDQGGVDIKVVTKPTKDMDKTRIFIPLNENVQRFYNEIGLRFLQFSKKDKQTIIEKRDKTQARIYRKGVFVRQIQSDNEISLFDYNLNTLNIDEARNSDDWNCRFAAASAISKDVNALKTVLQNLKYDYWECKFSHYCLAGGYLLQAWKSLYGDTVVCGHQLVSQALNNKRIKHILIENDNWFAALVQSGVVDGATKLGKSETKGFVDVAPSPELIKILDEVWAVVLMINMDNSKSKPKLQMFRKVAATQMLHGYVENGVIFVNEESVNYKTVLEEVLHYVSEQEDCTRNFQEVMLHFGAMVAFNRT